MNKLSRSQNMARIKSKNTSNELLLRRELWKRGLRYRTNDKTVFGKPDIAFKGKKIAVFIDSEFWHGKDFLEGKNIPKDNQEFWVTKLQKNIARDNLVNETLKSEGWRVVRFWAKEMKKNLDECTNFIERIVKETAQNKKS